MKDIHRNRWHFQSMCYLIFPFVFFNVATPESVVKTLPGYPGSTLPFKLETGYVSVGEMEVVELFYYFVESERDPQTDPLMLWLTGGPGCSVFCGLVYEIGPLTFDYGAFDGRSLPKFLQNPYSWTKRASILFLDSPVGTGFSYATTPEGYYSSDTKSTQDIHTFLRKWLVKHPKYIKNRLFIAGDSYAGRLVPMIAFKISQGIEAGLNPKMLLQGYVIGNPWTDNRIDGNAKVPFVHRMGILSDEYYEMARINCHGEYVEPTNALCLDALQFYEQCTKNLSPRHILEPKCDIISTKPNHQLGSARGYLEMEDDEYSLIRSLPQPSWCRDYNYLLSRAWANDVAVQEALHIRKGTIKEWIRCNSSILYDENVESVVHYHKLLMQKGYEALVYSGDHDMKVPYIGTLNWIRLLNLTVDDDWRPWFVNAQVAGYTERYIHEKTQSRLTFATVKGSGHTPPEYNPKECLAMVERFLELYPL